MTFSSSGGYLQVLDDNVIPSLLRPNVEFRVPSSISNNKILTVDDVAVFNNVTTTYYNNGGTSSMPDLVFYENRIYKCIQSYTQSATSSVVKPGLTDEEISKELSESYSATLATFSTVVEEDEETVLFDPINPLNKDYWQLTDFVYLWS